MFSLWDAGSGVLVGEHVGPQHVERLVGVGPAAAVVDPVQRRSQPLLTGERVQLDVHVATRAEHDRAHAHLQTTEGAFDSHVTRARSGGDT